MCIATAIREARVQKGLSQSEFGAIVGVSKSTVSNIELGKTEVPEDVVDRAVKKLNNMKLALEKCQECKSNHLIPKDLDGVDDSPVEILTKLIEEFEEGKEAAKKAMRDLKLHNKKSRKWITDKEFDKLGDYTEQLYDPVAGIFRWMRAFQELYKGSAKNIKLKNEKKLHGNGALTRKNI